MEPIEVTVRFDIDGRPHPLKFVWLGTQIPVASSGRRWEDEEGQHILVMDHQARVFELIFSALESRWFINENRRRSKNILST